MIPPITKVIGILTDIPNMKTSKFITITDLTNYIKTQPANEPVNLQKLLNHFALSHDSMVALTTHTTKVDQLFQHLQIYVDNPKTRQLTRQLQTALVYQEFDTLSYLAQQAHHVRQTIDDNHDNYLYYYQATSRKPIRLSNQRLALILETEVE